MAIMTIASKVDADIVEALDPIITAEKLIQVGVDSIFDLGMSTAEYKEFVKRNLKEFCKAIETALEDRL